MSESDFLEHLRRSSKSTSTVPIPIGDDLAGLTLPGDDTILIGVDQVLEGVHFLSTTEPTLVGRKAANRNLSDCAAMACLPTAALVCVALRQSVTAGWLDRMMAGVRQALAEFNCELVGGDTGSWPNPTALSVTILGRSAGLVPVRRSGAKPGDKLFVTGSLGGSILGRHLSFVPRVSLARELASHFELHAMIDLSDGLSRDLPRICHASGVGAILDSEQIPIHADVSRLADERSPLEHALHDGEDYELLFAAPHCDHPAAVEIGRIVEGNGVRIDIDGEEKNLEPLGWEHSL